MCEDLDFLDQVGELVEWLGFRLLRNPFIVDKALDDIVSSQLDIDVHDDRSLKYWSSASWRQNTRSKDNVLKVSKPVESVAILSLIKPLDSISPEDDVTDGSRIAAAQQILLDEESFHGRLRALKVVREYVDRGPSTFKRRDVASYAESLAVYDAIAVLNSQQKTAKYRSSLIRRERLQVERSVRDLRNQMQWTQLNRDGDRTNDQRDRLCREKYRQEALDLLDKLVDKLEHCVAVLKGEENHLGDVLDEGKCRMSELRVEKERQRVTRHNRKKEEEASRREGVRKKTAERSDKLRLKKKKPLQQHQSAVAVGSEKSNNLFHDDVTADIESDIRLIINKNSTLPEENQVSPEILRHQLEEKRQRMIYLKRARLEQQARMVRESELRLDCRRAENVAMIWEDILSRTVERESKRKAQLKANKELLDRIASCAIFKCMHAMNGKRYLISVYTRNAQRYDLEGLRVVAYDPRSSATFTLVMSLREFNSLGYGRTCEGLGAFSKWLCLLYEKRRRQFRLVWSGAPCPPPLRIRENDQTLVCLHKEGVKTTGSSTDSYSLVSVYLRTNDRSNVRFVVGSWHSHDFLLTEHVVAARSLVIGTDLDVQWRSPDHAMIVWKHQAHEQQKDEASSILTADMGQRIYSSEVVVNRGRYILHMYDTSEIEYTVELLPKPRKGDPSQQVSHSCVSRLVLYKRTVNPYNVRLSSSNFADLMSLIRFEQTRNVELTQESTEAAQFKWKATVSPKWAGKLANYVRVLRLAKYACKSSGVYCFVAVFIVQQKTEFRAHLLLEFTWLHPTFSSSFSLGGTPVRQSLRIPLSEYVRCVNASRRFAAGSTLSEDEECSSCLAYTDARTRIFEQDICPVPDTTLEHSSACSECDTIQLRRLHAIKELIIHAGAVAPGSLELIYDGYCGRCTTLVPPIVLVLGSAMSSSTTMWLLPMLGQYFASFDCSKNGFLGFEGGKDHTIAEHTRETLLLALARDQVAVLFNANCGLTVCNANLFVHELHWWLYPDHHNLPCHVAYLVGDQNDVVMDDRDEGDNEENDHASAFDAYLVAEAVLVEVTQVLLHPDYAWQKPREIIGASSWSAACNFLQDPVQLSAHLQHCYPLQISAATAEVVDAYFAHPKWPHDNPDVRPFFHGLLAFMMHLQHVRHILASRNGSLQISLRLQRVTEGEIAAEHEKLAKNTSQTFDGV
ncbi:hypothetical protein GN244_ATG12423 [Phytophthora infestans]|nr:hypothetical protein GN244_ATG12423 [Phytophthora infestans]